jgi:hypothetical protein
MPDITLCTNKQCGLRLDCHRFTAAPKPHWQSYAAFKPETVQGELWCDHYWPEQKTSITLK